MPQGSVLGPFLFLLYANDLPDEVTSNVYMFADDTKIYHPLTSREDTTILQNDLTVCKVSQPNGSSVLIYINESYVNH